MEERARVIKDYSYSVHKALRPFSSCLFYMCLSLILTFIISDIVGAIIVMVIVVLMMRKKLAERNRAILDFDKLLDESSQQSQELAALLEVSRSVMKYHDFPEAAGYIFGICKKLIIIDIF